MKDLAHNPLAADFVGSTPVTGTPPAEAALPALTAALGEAFARTAGTHVTRLRAGAAAGASSLSVESTLDWQSSGRLAIGGRIASYTGKTATTLTGLTWDAGKATVFPVGTVVEDATRRFSSLDQVRADMLPGMARGVWLDVVARAFGEARPFPMSDDTFRGLLQVLMTVPRGTWLASWQVLEAAFTDYHTRRTNGVTAAATPRRLSSSNGTFKAWHLHRFVRIGTRVYRIVGVDSGSGAWADLAGVGGPWWNAAAFGDATNVTFALLAFRMEVAPDVHGAAVVYVHAFLPSGFATAPPTYLQPDGALATPGGEPRGGELLASDNVAGGGHQPLYIGGGAVTAVQLLLEDVVPHGVEVRAKQLLP